MPSGNATSGDDHGQHERSRDALERRPPWPGSTTAGEVRKPVPRSAKTGTAFDRTSAEQDEQDREREQQAEQQDRRNSMPPYVAPVDVRERATLDGGGGGAEVVIGGS